MATTIYSHNVDVEQLNTSPSLAVLSVRPGSRVLDLGAADGSVARALKTRGCAVWGIELDEQAAEAARRVCDRVLVGDLETEGVWQAVEGETFDAILALDVLEHLRNPAAVLKRAGSYLNATGVAVVSLPNVTHGALRLSLLNGHFDYRPPGPLDRTHLRLFDRSGAERLMADGGLVILERLRVRRGLEETEIPVAKEEIPPSLAEILARDPDATTYQFVFVARRAAEDASIADGAMLSERLQRENEGLREQLLKLEQYAGNLQADRVATNGVLSERDELREELGRRMAEAHEMQRDLKHCKSEVAVKEAFITDLRAEILATHGVTADLTVQRDNLLSHQRDLTAERDNLLTHERDLTAQRDNLLSHQRELEASLSALTTYASSAGFRLVEKVIVQLKRVPLVFGPARAIVRMVAGRRDTRP